MVCNLYFNTWLNASNVSLSLNRVQCMQKTYIVMAYQKKLFPDSPCGKLDSSDQNTHKTAKLRVIFVLGRHDMFLYDCIF